MTDKEEKSKIADILLEFYEEYQCNISNRPMIPSLYASKIIDSMQEEPTIPDIVDEHFDEMLGEEPVSEDLEEAADNCYYRNHACARESFIEGAQWQKQQMMKDSVLCGVDGWFINNKRNCRKNGRFHKYYVSTITHDKPLPMENGKDYRLIIIKED